MLSARSGGRRRTPCPPRSSRPCTRGGRGACTSRRTTTGKSCCLRRRRNPDRSDTSPPGSCKREGRARHNTEKRSPCRFGIARRSRRRTGHLPKVPRRQLHRGRGTSSPDRSRIRRSRSDCNRGSIAAYRSGKCRHPTDGRRRRLRRSRRRRRRPPRLRDRRSAGTTSCRSHRRMQNNRPHWPRSSHPWHPPLRAIRHVPRKP
jgi:hypothetical protein